MKNFFSKHGIWILMVAAIVAVSMSALSAFGTGVATPLKNAVGIVATPFRAGAAALADWIDGRVRFAGEFDALKAENEALKEENARLLEEINQAKLDSAENEHLRELMNLRPQQREFQFESAMVVDHTSSNWTRTLTLSKGSAMGISVKDCVVDSQHHLVGVISEVGTNWATVLTTVDTDFELGATVFRSGEAAIASGDFNLMTQGLLRLNYISSDSALLNGDLIMTSGLGGYYPSNLIIGSVEEVVTDDSGAMEYGLLRPAVDFNGLTEVFVITDFTIVD